MAFKLSLAGRNAAVNSMVALFKTVSPSSINVYSDATSQPATPETSLPSGSVLLAKIPFNSGSGAFATATTGTGIPNGLPLTAAVIAAGTPSWFAFMDGTSGTPLTIGTGTISGLAGSGDMVFDNMSWAVSGIININSLTISVPM